jgi:leucine dehydrogenase
MHIEHLIVDGYERVVHFTDTDFSAYIAVHSTALGPALGGCRVKRYNSDTEALQDVLLLAKGMSYKSSLAGLQFGGGKCVVNADKATPEILRLVGKAVEHLDGLYITAEDVGTTFADMSYVAEETSHIAAVEPSCDGSAWTALGVFECIRAADRLMCDVLPDHHLPLHVHVEGLGKVGWVLAEHLHRHGCKLFVSDLRPELVEKAREKFRARPYTPDAEIHVYAPCAMGQVINDYTIDSLPPVVCGSANNQLATDDLAVECHNRGILYCPDYLVNAGGVIAASHELADYQAYRVRKDIVGIARVLYGVVSLARHMKVPPLTIANAVTEARMMPPRKQ